MLEEDFVLSLQLQSMLANGLLYASHQAFTRFTALPYIRMTCNGTLMENLTSYRPCHHSQFTLTLSYVAPKPQQFRRSEIISLHDFLCAHVCLFQSK